jgi:hypothetical protein
LLNKPQLIESQFLGMACLKCYFVLKKSKLYRFLEL